MATCASLAGVTLAARCDTGESPHEMRCTTIILLVVRSVMETEPKEVPIAACEGAWSDASLSRMEVQACRRAELCCAEAEAGSTWVYCWYPIALRLYEVCASCARQKHGAAVQQQLQTALCMCEVGRSMWLTSRGPTNSMAVMLQV